MRELREFVNTKTTVSMESGLEGRNNLHRGGDDIGLMPVSMESGLEGRNNGQVDNQGR